MAARRRRHPPLRCPDCGGRAGHVRDIYEDGSNQAGYRCGCGFHASDDEATYCLERGIYALCDDGRIRGPEDVAPRLIGTLERATNDPRLSDLDRDVLRVYCARADELSWV